MRSGSKTRGAVRATPRATPRAARSRRLGSYRQLVTAGDIAIGLGLRVARPAVRATTRTVRTAEQVGMRFGNALFESLPQNQQTALRSQSESLRSQTSTLAQSGREARVDTVESLVGAIVAEAIRSDVVRVAMRSAASQAVDEVVDAAMPGVVEQLRSEIGPRRLDDMVRSSVERVLPEVIERDLSNAIATAAGIPARTARGLARLPASVLRPAGHDEGYDE
jgi:hypothetical protein